MKDSYLCNVDEDERRSAVGSEKLLSGLAKFFRCPARKNREVGSGKAWVTNYLLLTTKKHYNYDNESESSREETEVYEGP